jgi:hypothetical protein
MNTELRHLYVNRLDLEYLFYFGWGEPGDIRYLDRLKKEIYESEKLLTQAEVDEAFESARRDMLLNHPPYSNNPDEGWKKYLNSFHRIRPHHGVGGANPSAVLHNSAGDALRQVAEVAKSEVEIQSK